MVKVRCPYDDPHVPTVSHLWAAANWHERETHEMFGIVFDGHPDLRPLLTEEGLGYYILRKSHPLAEIEEWQEDYLDSDRGGEDADGQSPRAARRWSTRRRSRSQMAQAKAAVITKTRAEARAKGLSPEDEKAAVTAALAKFEEEQAAAGGRGPAGGGAPMDPKAAKIQMAQAKAKVITKARGEARAKGMSTEDEKLFVAEALKKFSDEQSARAGCRCGGRRRARRRHAKIQMAQAKAKIITKTREEARAQGLVAGRREAARGRGAEEVRARSRTSSDGHRTG